MATNDPSKALDVESLDKGARELDKTTRAAKLGSFQAASNGDKSIHRQRLLLNNLRDRGEDVLMTLAGVNAPEIKVEEAKAMREGLRGLLFEIYKGTDFLEVAQQGGYEKAENMLTKNKALTEEGKEAIKGIKSTDKEKPYSRTVNNQQKRRQFTPYQHYGSYPQPSSPMMQNTFPMMQQAHMMQPGSSMMQPYRQQQNFPGPYNNNPYGGTGPQFGMPFQAKVKGPGPDKSRSTCKACLKIGHWAGDMACPLNGFQPPPPGI